jgi:glutathione S-transferase
MIDVHYWTTPNGHKITIFLEETGLEYKVIPVNIGKGEQFKTGFLAVSPNNRIPAIVDHDPAGGGKPIAVFESGAILLYLADKTGKFAGNDLRSRTEAIQWLFWQMGGLGPMAGQNNHFSNYAVEKLQYAMDRYRNEVNRLYGVMNKRLADRPYLDRRHGELSVDRAVGAPGPETFRLPEPAALVRGHQGAARGGQGLRVDAQDQSRPGRHPHRGRARDFVRPDRAVGQHRRSARAVIHDVATLRLMRRSMIVF